MAAPAKFLFDTDFARRTSARARTTAAEIAQKIAKPRHVPIARLRGGPARGQGGERSPRGAGAGRDRYHHQGIASRFGIEARMETEAVEVAVAVARKLCSELVSREPLGEITALRRLLLPSGRDPAPRRPHQRPALRRRPRKIERQAAQSGFEGPAGDPGRAGIATGDLRIEWADGGVVLERAAIEAKISELVGRYMASAIRPEREGHED